MQGFAFTEGARISLAQGREEAVQLGHDYVGPEHVFLGLLASDKSIIPAVLRRFGVDAPALVAEIRAGTSRRGPIGGPDIPFSSAAKKTIELAMSEAHHLRHQYIGCEHLLLGIIKEGQSSVAKAFVAHGVTLDVARAEVLQLLGEDTVATGFEWLSELGTLTRQLGDSLADVKHPRTPEDLLLVVVSDDCGARHILEISGVTIDGLKREVLESAEASRAPKSLREFIQAAKSEQQFLGDCALASHHLLLAYLALRPAHGYRALSEAGVTHASVRALAEKIFG